MVLGADAKIKVKGPSGPGQQEVKIFGYGHEAPAVSRMTVHAFGQRGRDALAALPLKDYIKASRTGIPPPKGVTVLVAGNLKSIDIEGPQGKSQQQINFSIFAEQNADHAAFTTELMAMASTAATTVAARASKARVEREQRAREERVREVERAREFRSHPYEHPSRGGGGGFRGGGRGR